MPISTVDGIANGLAQKRQPLLINKASIANASAGNFFSLWRATGTPGQGAIPTAAAIPDSTLLGALPFSAPAGSDHSYLAQMSILGSNSGSDIQIHDRLGHMGGLSGTSTTAQTVNLDLTGTTNNLANRRGAADYSDVLWWLEWYADTGATASNATVNVTYDDGSSGNLATIAVGGTVRASRMIALQPAVAGRYIRAVNTVTLSANTTAAGNFGVTATRLLATLPVGLANVSSVADWAMLGLPRVHDSAALMLVQVPTTTTTGTLFGRIALIQG